MKDIKIYELSWNWYEDYIPYLFSCEKTKTNEEFKADCIRAMEESFDDYINSIDYQWASLPRWVEFSISKLCSFGYNRIITIKVVFFGGYLPKEIDEEKEDFKDFQDSCLKKIIEHNEKFEKELYPRRTKD